MNLKQYEERRAAIKKIKEMGLNEEAQSAQEALDRMKLNELKKPISKISWIEKHEDYDNGYGTQRRYSYYIYETLVGVFTLKSTKYTFKGPMFTSTIEFDCNNREVGDQICVLLYKHLVEKEMEKMNEPDIK